MITLHDALTANEFWHMRLLNADGTPKRARRNGKTQTWKKWPELFRIPVKNGHDTYFYIQNFSHREPNTPAGAPLQDRNDGSWCTRQKWPAEHVLFEGVTT